MIVFDSSTLILLAKSELLDLFIENLKAEIVIAKSVEKECCIKNTFDSLIIGRRIEEGKIDVAGVKGSKKLQNDFNMGKGEGDSIILAMRNKCLLATDDKSAINACKVLRVPFTTAIDILTRAYVKKLIEKEEALMKLKKLARFGRYAERIMEDANKKLENGKTD